MSEQITIAVSEQVARRAESVARIRRQPIEEVLADLLERAVEELPVDLLPDEDVLALAAMTSGPTNCAEPRPERSPLKIPPSL